MLQSTSSALAPTCPSYGARPTRQRTSSPMTACRWSRPGASSCSGSMLVNRREQMVQGVVKFDQDSLGWLRIRHPQNCLIGIIYIGIIYIGIIYIGIIYIGIIYKV